MDTIQSTPVSKPASGLVDMAYSKAFTEMPSQPTIKKPGQLTEDQVKQFFNEGFLIVEDFFTKEQLQPCCDDIEMMVDNLAKKLYAAGKIQELHEEHGLYQRLTELDREFPGAAILLFKSQKMTKSFQNLLADEKMLNVAEQMLGPEVAGHPVWNLRPKIPKNKTVVVPWHQDSAYFDDESYEHMIFTAWVPFLDTDAHNGGMQMARYGHRTGKVGRHTCSPGDTWYVVLEEEEIKNNLGVDLEKDIVTCKVPYGGMLLFQNMIPHRSLSNTSNNVRWSCDLRWQSPTEKWGFYNLQEGILLRSAKEPNLIPDWQKHLSVDRKIEWQKRYCKEEEAVDEFDTRVTGPWFGRWEVVNHNRHTDSFNYNNNPSK